MLDDSLGRPGYPRMGRVGLKCEAGISLWGLLSACPLCSLEQWGTKVARAGSRTVSNICLPQLSNREGGGVWIEPQDKEYAAADRADQKKQLCPQENELHIPFSDPTLIPSSSKCLPPTPPYMHTQHPHQLEGPPHGLGLAPLEPSHPHPSSLNQRLQGRSPAVWKGESTLDRWPEADGEGPYPGPGSTCQTGPPSDSPVCALFQEGPGTGGGFAVTPRLGKPRQDLGHVGCMGRRVCVVLMARPVNIWSVLTVGGSSGGLQSERGGRQQVEIRLPGWLREVIPLHSA
ncbi:hypothetical protein HJG60_010560 [Phyllostomus discolor]|uniref:Uncharacterized protein n=1 Tax=Phyllostomus discolor TaxID=89673 RepID=A0A834EBC3_9CHIR|nr:hypothetical protein HJG60_010560 [Phyllostomus discolor]